MKHKLSMVAAIAAAGFGTALLVGTVSQSPALADRPGYYPGSSIGGSGDTSGGGGGTESGSLAVLTGTDPEARIYVYPSPSTEVDPIGYGFAGDEVQVFDSVEGYALSLIHI